MRSLLSKSLVRHQYKDGSALFSRSFIPSLVWGSSGRVRLEWHLTMRVQLVFYCNLSARKRIRHSNEGKLGFLGFIAAAQKGKERKAKDKLMEVNN